ncbi:MAG TPA: PilZ domain-containing protein [Mariprofundaceae bacterium]|nr:PilZ domain-containing protein [Mariprofundaceae bacterium]
MSEKGKVENRSSERHPIEFKVDIYSSPDAGRQFLEKAVLKDISGTGVCFITHNPGLYTVGQEIDLDINMPGSEKLGAMMECRARIVRLDLSEQQAAESRAQVGILMSSLLSFQQHQPAEKSDGDESAVNT